MSQTVLPPAEPQPPAIHLPKPSLMPLAWGAGFMLIAFGVIMGVARKPTGVPVAPGDFWLSGIGLLLILVATGGWLWGNIRERSHGSETPVVAAKFAMWCFLGTEVIIRPVSSSTRLASSRSFRTAVFSSARDITLSRVAHGTNV